MSQEQVASRDRSDGWERLMRKSKIQPPFAPLCLPLNPRKQPLGAFLLTSPPALIKISLKSKMRAEVFSEFGRTLEDMDTDATHCPSFHSALDRSAGLAVQARNDQR